MSPRLSRLVPVLVAVCASLAFFAAPAPAATPCWKLLLNDWYDGTISKIYPTSCYRQAINHLPTDVQVYSSARDDILRALHQALAVKKHPAANTVTTPTTSQPRSHTTSTPVTAIHKNPPGGFSGAIRHITPGGADAFPLPLLILGLLAIVLVLAGVGGMLWRRYYGGGGAPPAAPGGS